MISEILEILDLKDSKGHLKLRIRKIDLRVIETFMDTKSPNIDI
jgi:hypothetical protein